MNTSSVYVNEAVEYAFSTYVRTKDHKGTLDYNSFMCTVVRLLLIIFGEEIILDYQTQNPATLIFTLTKYGTSLEDANNFLTILERYYQFEEKEKDKAIKKKNKFFNPVQKYLIDMFVTKNKMTPFDKKAIKEFYMMLFTAKSRSFYRKSTAIVKAYNPYEIDEYFRKQDWGI